MSELAFNINGESFEVPANATGWRARKMRSKGPPEVVYAREGHPLVLPINAEIDDLRAEVDTTGRYRLDLVDQNNKTIEGAPSGYVHINLDIDAGSSSSPGSGSGDRTPSTTSIARHSDNVVIEAMRMNSEIAKSVVDRFPMMLEAAATLLRAADGAGLPARTPVVQDDGRDDSEGDEDDEIDAGPTGFDLKTLIAQLAPMLMTAFASGSIKLPSAASVLDWRKATPTATKKAVAPRPVAVTAEASDEDFPPLDAKTMTHFISIQSVLDPDEAALAREVASSLSPTELRAWFDDLSRLSVADAVTKIRTLLGAKKGSAS